MRNPTQNNYETLWGTDLAAAYSVVATVRLYGEPQQGANRVGSTKHTSQP